MSGRILQALRLGKCRPTFLDVAPNEGARLQGKAGDRVRTQVNLVGEDLMTGKEAALSAAAISRCY